MQDYNSNDSDLLEIDPEMIGTCQVDTVDILKNNEGRSDRRSLMHRNQRVPQKPHYSSNRDSQ